MRITFTKNYQSIAIGTQMDVPASTALQLLAEGFITINDALNYPAGKASAIEVRLTRPADVIQYTAGDAINSSVATPVSVQLTPFALANGKGAWITGINVATNLLNLASSTIRIWLYRTTPTMVGDNVAMTNLDANTALGRQYIDVTFGPLLAGSAVIIGQVAPMLLMQCDAAHADIQQSIQTLATFTPVSAGFIDVTYTILQL